MEFITKDYLARISDEGGNYYELMPGIVSFYSTEAESIIEQAIALNGPISEGSPLLDSVSAYYFSISSYNRTVTDQKLDAEGNITESSTVINEKAVSYIDAEWALSRFFGNGKLEINNQNDYMYLANSISYMMNVRAKCRRLANLLEHDAIRMVVDKPIRKGIMFLAAGCVRKVGDTIGQNCAFIYENVGIEVLSNFHLWYEGIREGMKQQDNKMTYLRIDAFFKQELYMPFQIKNWKKDNERKQVNNATHAMRLLLNPPQVETSI